MKVSTDILELGKHLVRELDFNGDRDNTLGIWMAHHLAELIDAAENAETATLRKKAQREASDTILKVWKHRSVLPGHAYPLTQFENVLRTMDSLQQERTPFLNFFHHGESKKDQLTAEIYKNSPLLIMALLLHKIDTQKRSLNSKSAAIKALGPQERQVWMELDNWLDSLAAPKKSTFRKTKASRQSEGKKIDFDERALRLIDELAGTLGELKIEIKKKAS
ncbi:MAG: hypothetical protein HDKAJFGB_01432 [Anaerolineae bacterium]|nr:hypothetical protein [Anaerolineae bacterium]